MQACGKMECHAVPKRTDALGHHGALPILRVLHEQEYPRLSRPAINLLTQHQSAEAIHRDVFWQAKPVHAVVLSHNSDRPRARYRSDLWRFAPKTDAHAALDE